jgi:hypothetical protein
MAERQPVALGPDHALVHGGGDRRDGRARRSLGHGEDQDTAIGGRQQPTLGHGPAGRERRREIEAAQEPVLADMQRHPADRCFGRQQDTQQP